MSDDEIRKYARLYQIIYWLRTDYDILEVQCKLGLSDAEFYEALVELTKAGFLKVSVA